MCKHHVIDHVTFTVYTVTVTSLLYIIEIDFNNVTVMNFQYVLGFLIAYG